MVIILSEQKQNVNALNAVKEVKESSLETKVFSAKPVHSGSNLIQDTIKQNVSNIMNSKQLSNFVIKIKVDELTGCWLWQAQLSYEGYAKFQIGRKNALAHRVAYEYWVGKIPKGLEIDHLCRTRNCVNPQHLEAVDHDENRRRGTSNNQYKNTSHCIYGHPFSGKNLYIQPNGERRCRICRRRTSSEYLQRIKEKQRYGT